MTLSVLPSGLSRRKRRGAGKRRARREGIECLIDEEGLVTVGLAWLQMPNRPPRKASGDKAPGPSTPCPFFFYPSPFSFSSSQPQTSQLHEIMTSPGMRNSIWSFSEGP